MHKIDMRSDTTVAMGINATLSGTTPAAGNIVDVRDFQAATFCLTTGTVTVAGTGGIGVVVQESDTTVAADFAAVADADLLGLESELAITSNDADGLAVGCIGYRGTKPFVRVVATGTTNTNAVVAGIWTLQGPRYAPKGNAAANIAAT